MSFSLSVPNTRPETFEADAEKALEVLRTAYGAGDTALSSEASEMIDTGIAVATTLLSAVGADEMHNVNVTIAGHANPGHTPPPGWSPDFLNVSVGRLPA